MLFNNSSIFNFKQLSSYGQALKSTSTDVGELSKLTSLLTTEQTINALSSKGLTDQQVVQILMNKGIVQSEAEAIATKMASSTANGVATFSIKAYTVALWENIKAIGAWMLSNPVGWVIGLGVAIVGTTAIINSFGESIEEQKKKVNDLRDEYNSLKDDLSSLNNQIKENNDIIKELQTKSDEGTITLVEEDQLRKLRLQNELLEQQRKVQEDLANEAKTKLIKENKETFYNEFGGSVDDNYDNNYDIREYYAPGLSDYKQASDQNLVLMAKANQDKLKKAVLSGDEELVKILEKDKILLTNELNERSDTVLLSLIEYQNNLANAMNDDGTFDDASDKTTWDNIESWKKSIYEYTNRSGEWNTLKINTVLEDESLDKAMSEITKKFSEGTLTGADLLKFKDLTTALYDANLILEDGETVASAFLKYLLQIATSQKEVNATRPDFTFDDVNNKSVDEYQSSLNSLTGTLDKLKNGDLSSGELIDLLQDFPELMGKTDNLSEAIQTLIDDKLKKLRTELKEAGASDEILDLLDDMTNMSQNVKLDDALSQLESTHSVIEDLKSEIAETDKISVSTLQNIASQYPRLEQAVSDYLSGKIEENDIIQALQEEYKTDLDNYYLYLTQKKGEDIDFYSTIRASLSNDLIDKANQYGIDLLNYKTYNEAKLEMDKKYALKKARLLIETDKYEAIENDIQKDPLNPSLYAKAEKALGNVTKAQKELADVEKVINDFDTSIKVDIPSFTTNLNYKPKKDSNEDKEFSEDIDWIAKSVENAQKKVDDLDNTLSNTKGFKNRLDVYKDLNEANEELVTSTENAANEYEGIWEAKSSKVDKKYVDLITGGISEQYNNAVAERKSKYKGSKYAGNVDLYNRPILFDDEGYYETLHSETYNYSDFGIDKKGAFNVTPILPDGTKIENLPEYITKQLKSGKKIEDLDIFLGGDYSSIDEATKEAIKLHEEQDKIYGKEAEHLATLKESLSVENFDSEEEYNKVMELIDSYGTWQAAEDKHDEALEKQKADQDAINSLYLERAQLNLDTLNTEDQSTMTVKEKNAWLEKEKLAKAEILKYDLLLIDSEEERLLKEKEYAQYLAKNEEDQYQNLRQERSNRADYFGTRIQDIQNEIALQEARGGQGEASQYEEMNSILDSQIGVYKIDYDEALAKRNAEDPRTDKWYQYNKEIQEAQDNINACKIAQIENNKAIKLLPIKYYEDLNKKYERQLEIATKSRELIENGIGYANTLIQDQIDLLNEDKETAVDNYDDQIKILQKQKDTLTDSNDEIERAINLENAKYNLEKALNNKKVRIYKKGEGFVYEADQDEVRKAQQEVDTLTRENEIAKIDKEIETLNKQKESEVEIIDDKIKAWEKYSKEIEKVVAAYDKIIAKKDFSFYFGEGSIDNVLAQDSSILPLFDGVLQKVRIEQEDLQNKIDANNLVIQVITDEAEAYVKGAVSVVEAREKIDTVVKANEDEIAAMELRTGAVNTYNQAWVTTQQSVDESLKKIEISNTNAKDIENLILTERINNLEIFKNTAVSYYKDIATALSSAESSYKQIQKLLASTKTAYVDILDYVQKAIAAKASMPSSSDTSSNKNGAKNTTKGTTKGTTKNNQVYAFQSELVDIYHEGGIVGETPQHDIPEHLIALTDANLKPNETFAKLLNGEVVLNPMQMGNIFDNLSRAYSAITPLNKRENLPITVSIGDVNVYNPDNTDMIVDEIVKELPLKVVQKLHSK